MNKADNVEPSMPLEARLNQKFQVDLGGIVELLSRNLYSGWRVFVRELLQNGYDAITARQNLIKQTTNSSNKSTWIPKIRFLTDKTQLKVIDNGIGLDINEAKTLLSTIGLSSKRDELGLVRQDYLGQFGIGLLSCFLVSHTITVYSRSAKDPDSPVIKWEGNANGIWSVQPISAAASPPELVDCGTCVILKSLPGEQYFEYGILAQLIKEFGDYLPVQISLEGQRGQEQNFGHRSFPFSAPNEKYLRQWCATELGFDPFAAFSVHCPAAGLDGMAYVLSTAADPLQISHHQVYLRNMLLTKNSTDLLPPWAYFIRLVINTTHIQPTASREQLFTDDLLIQVKDELGTQIRQWLTMLAKQYPQAFNKFISLHLDGLKALAISDTPTRKLVFSHIPYLTSVGHLTLEEVVNYFGAIRYCTNVDEYRAIEPLANANEICVVNAGFAFDEQILGLISLDLPQVGVQAIDPAELLGALQPLSLDQEFNLLPFLEQATNALSSQNLQVELRNFAPATLPVVYLPASQALAASLETINLDIENSSFAVDELTDISKLNSLIAAAESAQSGTTPPCSALVFNAACPIVNKLAVSKDPTILESAVRGLYVQALLTGHHPLDTQTRSWSTTIFTSLINRSLETED